MLTRLAGLGTAVDLPPSDENGIIGVVLDICCVGQTEEKGLRKRVDTRKLEMGAESSTFYKAVKYGAYFHGETLILDSRLSDLLICVIIFLTYVTEIVCIRNRCTQRYRPSRKRPNKLYLHYHSQSGLPLLQNSYYSILTPGFLGFPHSVF